MGTGTGKARKERYAYNDEEKEKILTELFGDDDNNDDDGASSKAKVDDALKNGKVAIQRFKGLGEMMAGQLWTTTMDPTTRTLLQVTANDCARADLTLSVLMGDAVVPRK